MSNCVLLRVIRIGTYWHNFPFQFEDIFYLSTTICNININVYNFKCVIILYIYIYIIYIYII